ncbi:tyrosine-type recombinase/integrase [Nocardia carnea]|uniref:tyrosine-type recombinase/integrase n=1 Tax=Nocardia carnea TaxID=37328 RepID=UPI002454C377|nr:tyrosine-type recombinase/integrase [Nocardia carnea]
MARRSTPESVDLAALLPSWELALRAERKAPQTVKSYTDGVRAFLRWCESTGTDPVLTRGTVQAFTVSLLDGGAEPSTARSRQLAVKRFSTWLAEEGELDTDPLLGLRPVKLDVKVTPSLTEDQVKALIKACQGREMWCRRDEAIVRLMVETGARAGEVVGLTLADIDLPRGLATVRRGKGGKGRIIPFGAQTGRAIDRYLRTRRGHLLSESGALWLGDRGKSFGYDGLHKSLTYRARLAGIDGFHPHLLRHTAASRWLAAGGSEGGLMAVAGWKRRDMLDRYTAATASERAAAEARGLNLGDL